MMQVNPFPYRAHGDFSGGRHWENKNPTHNAPCSMASLPLKNKDTVYFGHREDPLLFAPPLYGMYQSYLWGLFEDKKTIPLGFNGQSPMADPVVQRMLLDRDIITFGHIDGNSTIELEDYKTQPRHGAIVPHNNKYYYVQLSQGFPSKPPTEIIHQGKSTPLLTTGLVMEIHDGDILKLGSTSIPVVLPDSPFLQKRETQRLRQNKPLHVILHPPSGKWRVIPDAVLAPNQPFTINPPRLGDHEVWCGTVVPGTRGERFWAAKIGQLFTPWGKPFQPSPYYNELNLYQNSVLAVPLSNGTTATLNFFSEAFQNVESSVSQQLIKERHDLVKNRKIIWIGSHPNCEIQLPGSLVSPHHCFLQYSPEDRRFYISSPNTQTQPFAINGNGNRRSNQQYPLYMGDQLQLGNDFTLNFPLHDGLSLGQTRRVLDGLFPDKSPFFQQNTTGDCYILAAIGALQEHRSDLLKACIRPLESGSWVVEFPVGVETVIHPHDLNTPLDTLDENGRPITLSPVTKGPNGVKILERAIGRVALEYYQQNLYQDKRKTLEILNLGGHSHHAAVMLSGGLLEHVWELDRTMKMNRFELYGSGGLPFSPKRIKPWVETFHREIANLSQDLNQGNIVLFASSYPLSDLQNPNLLQINDEYYHFTGSQSRAHVGHPWLERHAYYISEIIPGPTLDSTYVTVVNPHNTAPAKRVQIPLTEALHVFRRMSVVRLPQTADTPPLERKSLQQLLLGLFEDHR